MSTGRGKRGKGGVAWQRPIPPRKLARDLVPGDIVLDGMMPRRVLHSSCSPRTGTVFLSLRTEWGAEYNDTFGMYQEVQVLP